MADDKAKDGTPTGKVDIASNRKLDQTIPGGSYINAQGQRVNAHGQRIDEKGNVTDGTKTPVQEPPR